MTVLIEYISKKGKFIRTNNVLVMWISLFLLIGTAITPLIAMQGIAAPVIIDEDSFGSWEDIFEDTAGIDSWDNLQLRNEAIELMNIPIFSDNFTGTNGDPPDPSKWDLIDDGYTLEIENNQLKTSSTPNNGNWYSEMVRTNLSFSMNHTLTWRQQLYLVSGTGMYYHLRVWDGSLNPLFGINQNSADEYMIYNYGTASGILLDMFVSGWHDYKIIFTNGFVEFFFDGVKKFEYDYGVSSIKYQFGNHQLSEPGTILTDDVLISTYQPKGNLTSTEIILPEGQTWDSLIIDKTEIGTENKINVTVLDGLTYLPIPGFENLDSLNVDISSIDHLAYPTLRLRAHFYGDTFNTPVLEGWKVTWLDTIAPETPKGLSVHDPFTGDSLILSWNFNTEPDVVHYDLFYSVDNVTFIWLAEIPANSPSFYHEGLIQGKSYYYKISAEDEIPNQSPFSEGVEGNPDLDMDEDGIGNSIDPDIDGDTVLNGDDAFPLNGNEWYDTDSDGIGNNADWDDDNDSYHDEIDDFPWDDTEWKDTDGDGIGDNTDDDIDGDGYNNTVDDFDFDPNEWLDSDNDSIGDNADNDDDNDGYMDVIDDFPWDDTEWNDLDHDGIGDNSDNDIDGDGYINAVDDFDFNSNEWLDSDGDGIGDNADMDDDEDGYNDVIDDFPLDDSEWNDLDNDGIGDNTDNDIDGDGYNNTLDDFELNPNEWLDSDSDGIGDIADYDDDGDTYIDSIDDFPLDITEWNDLDDDGIGDNNDIDKDGDGILNIADEFPGDPTEWEDTDSDGLGDNKDLDIDGDEVDNFNDAFPYNLEEWRDLDSDGIGDNNDEDKDGDGVLNDLDSFSENAFEWKDLDEDNVGDNTDTDDDGDGYFDVNDGFPYDATEWYDLDSDGIGDNSDSDKDGDGVANNVDLFPTLSHEWEDSDLDGIGDNSDLDDDNDKHLDTNDDYPFDSSKWQKPNELLPLLYLILILLVVVIILGVVFIVISKKGTRSSNNEPFTAPQKQGPQYEDVQKTQVVEKPESDITSTESQKGKYPPPPPSD